MSKEILLYETDFWKVKLLQNQAYLGRCIITLKRECGNLANLTIKEWEDLQINIIQKLEFVFKKVFNTTLFNWACLMNNAFKSENPKPQVHWHLIPRYKEVIELEGIKFQDLEFAHHYNRKRIFLVSEGILIKIAEKIKTCL